MIVFWWTGRGYVTALIIIGMMTVFGLAQNIAQPLVLDRQWYWGLSLIAAAGVNWWVGSYFNRDWFVRSRLKGKLRLKGLKNRLFYRTANRFMSVPMETFSIALAIAGAAITVHGIVTPGA